MGRRHCRKFIGQDYSLSVPKGNLPTLEEELRRLRAENKRLQMERDILKKATAFFAKESL
jgi:transposase-like protein